MKEEPQLSEHSPLWPLKWMFLLFVAALVAAGIRHPERSRGEWGLLPPLVLGIPLLAIATRDIMLLSCRRESTWKRRYRAASAIFAIGSWEYSSGRPYDSVGFRRRTQLQFGEVLSEAVEMKDLRLNRFARARIWFGDTPAELVAPAARRNRPDESNASLSSGSRHEADTSCMESLEHRSSRQ